MERGGRGRAGQRGRRRRKEADACGRLGRHAGGTTKGRPVFRVRVGCRCARWKCETRSLGVEGYSAMMRGDERGEERREKEADDGRLFRGSACHKQTNKYCPHWLCLLCSPLSPPPPWPSTPILLTFPLFKCAQVHPLPLPSPTQAPSSSSTMGGLAILQTLATLCAVTLNVCPIFDEIPGTCFYAWWWLWWCCWFVWDF